MGRGLMLVRRFLWLAAGAVTLALGAASAAVWLFSPPPPAVIPADAGVSVSRSQVYYDIRGRTAGELRREMDRLAPADARGRHDAYTRWFVTWSFPSVVQGDGCVTGPVTIHVRITSTFPRWQAPADPEPGLVERWNAYLAALERHEEGHEEIPVKAAREIRQTLGALPAHPSCRELNRAANVEARKILDRHRQEELLYDAHTRHGAAQGARFP